MQARVDSAGNIRGVCSANVKGKGSRVRRLFIGSHLDTVPNAGPFDGVLGVVLAIALIELLGERQLPFDIEVLGFSDEEGVRFGLPFIGSRVVAGSLDLQILGRRDEQNKTVKDAIGDFGLDPAHLADERADASSATGYLEFHIEQGPTLDNLNLPVAVVDAIVGQTRVDVMFTGMAAHAGTTPMKDRRDALAGAAILIAEVEREANAVAGLVGTVGRADVEPGAGNVVPGKCRLSLDVRHIDNDIRKMTVDRLAKSAKTIASARRLELAWETQIDQSSVAMDAGMASKLDRAVTKAGLRAHRMLSGAGHDAMIMASCMPASMLFLRSPGGISHHPAETVREDDVAAALEVGLKFLDELAQD